MKKLLPVLLVSLFATWTAFWFWFFSFQYSTSFFHYNLETRLPFLVLSLLAIAVAPLSGYRAIHAVIREQMTSLKAAVQHALIATAPLALFWAIAAGWRLLARLSGGIAFEADEAMGIGIDFMICVAVVLVSCLVVGIALAAITVIRGKKSVAQS